VESLQLTVHKRIMDRVIAILDGIFFALTVFNHPINLKNLKKNAGTV
jgi:preprotein translocase subunit SecG